MARKVNAMRNGVVEPSVRPDALARSVSSLLGREIRRSLNVATPATVEPVFVPASTAPTAFVPSPTVTATPLLAKV